MPRTLNPDSGRPGLCFKGPHRLRGHRFAGDEQALHRAAARRDLRPRPQPPEVRPRSGHAAEAGDGRAGTLPYGAGRRFNSFTFFG